MGSWYFLNSPNIYNGELLCQNLISKCLYRYWKALQSRDISALGVYFYQENRNYAIPIKRAPKQVPPENQTCRDPALDHLVRVSSPESHHTNAPSSDCSNLVVKTLCAWGYLCFWYLYTCKTWSVLQNVICLCLVKSDTNAKYDILVSRKILYKCKMWYMYLVKACTSTICVS